MGVVVAGAPVLSAVRGPVVPHFVQLWLLNNRRAVSGSGRLRGSPGDAWKCGHCAGLILLPPCRGSGVDGAELGQGEELWEGGRYLRRVPLCLSHPSARLWPQLGRLVLPGLGLCLCSRIPLLKQPLQLGLLSPLQFIPRTSKNVPFSLV